MRPLAPALVIIVGALLTVYGAARPLLSTSVGININLAWGVILLVFGTVMILLGRRGSPAPKTPAASPQIPARGKH